MRIVIKIKDVQKTIDDEIDMNLDDTEDFDDLKGDDYFND